MPVVDELKCVWTARRGQWFFDLCWCISLDSPLWNSSPCWVVSSDLRSQYKAHRGVRQLSWRSAGDAAAHQGLRMWIRSGPCYSSARTGTTSPPVRPTPGCLSEGWAAATGLWAWSWGETCWSSGGTLWPGPELRCLGSTPWAAARTEQDDWPWWRLNTWHKYLSNRIWARTRWSRRCRRSFRGPDLWEQTYCKVELLHDTWQKVLDWSWTIMCWITALSTAGTETDRFMRPSQFKLL